MDWLPIGFLLLIILVVGPLVAIVADELGRRLGKKRLSYKKLRPKHVARIGTAIAGAAIALVTVLIVFLASSGVRSWILEGRGAIARAQRLSGEVSDLQSQARELEKTNVAKTNEARRLDQQLNQQREKVRESQKRLQEAEAQVRVARGRVDDLTRQVREGTRRIAQTTRELERRRQELSALRETSRQIQVAASEAVKQRDEAQGDNNLLLRLNEELRETLRTRQREIGQLEQSRKDLEASVKSARDELEASRGELEAARRQLGETNNSLQNARALLAQQQQALNTALPNALFSRLSPLNFRAGEELARIQMPAMQSRAEAQAAFDRLLRDAGNVAIQRGATGTGNSPAAVPFPLNDPDTGRSLTSAELETRIVSGMTGQSEPIAVVAITEWNHFRGEQVLLRFQPYRNPVIYNRDQPIAEARVDGRNSPEEVYRDLTAFFTGPIRERAIRDRMIPVRGAEESFGMITTGQILDAVARIREENRVVRVIAVVRESTRAADPLDLYLRIR